MWMREPVALAGTVTEIASAPGGGQRGHIDDHLTGAASGLRDRPATRTGVEYEDVRWFPGETMSGRSLRAADQRP